MKGDIGVILVRVRILRTRKRASAHAGPGLGAAEGLEHAAAQIELIVAGERDLGAVGLAVLGIVDLAAIPAAALLAEAGQDLQAHQLARAQRRIAVVAVGQVRIRAQLVRSDDLAADRRTASGDLDDAVVDGGFP
ncbi:hypothetical protein QU38_02155, partial [Staphylococcus aureus]